MKGDEILSETRLAEAKLLRAFASGSKAGFTAFYKRFAGTLFSTTSRILGEGKASEDAMQEAFVQMRTRSAQFNAARGSLFAWAVTITRDVAVRRLRSSRSPVPQAAMDTTKSLSPEAERTNEAAGHDWRGQSRVPAASVFLTRGEREALELCFFDGLTASQVSHKLGIPAGELRATVRRGLFGFLHAISSEADTTVNRSRLQAAPILA